MKISTREITSLIDSLRDFLKSFDHASEFILRLLLKTKKAEIGSTKSKDNLFAHYYNDINEHPNRQVRLSLRFGNNQCCEFATEKFELHGNQFVLTECVNLSCRKIHHLYKNRYNIANNC